MDLIQTKLAPPRLRAELIQRTRLLERLREARRRKLVLITGPAGYGKTCLAGAWRQDLMEQGWQVAWLTLNHDDDDLARFVGYLAGALRECGVSGEALEMFQRDRSEDPGEVFVVALANSLSRLGSQVCLVLDDFQELTSSGALRVVQHLLEYAPQNFHLCLLSRQRPALSLAKLRVSDEIGEIDVADLRFSEEETAKYVASRIGPLSTSEMRKLYELTDGWVAALLLVELALGKRSEITEFLRLRPASLRSFNELLDAEVLDKLPHEQFKLLVRAAACRRLNGPLCHTLSGVARADEILAQLYERNLFLTEIEGSDHLTWYRFHPLLRQRLLEHFLNLEEGEQAAVNRSACEWFSKHGYNDEAVRHAIYAGDIERAADLIESCARPLVYSGKFRRLIDWAGSLPVATTAKRLELQLSLGWAQIFSSRTEVTLDTCRRIESIIDEGDQRSQYELLLLRGAVAVLQDDSEAACAAVLDATRVPESAGTLLTGIRANILTWSLAYKGDHDGSRDAYLSARFSASDEVAPVRRIIGECFHGMSLVLQGEMVLAERVLRDAFATGSKLAGAHAEPACIVAGFLGEVLYESGEIDEVIKLVGERADLIERLAPLDIPLRGLISLARAQRVRGNRDEAASILAHLEEIAVVNNHDRALANSLGEQVTWCLADGDRDGAGDVMRRLAKLSEAHPLEPLNATSEIVLLAGLKRIEMDLFEGRPRDALEHADILLAKCEAWRRNQLVVRLKLMAVRAHLGLRDSDSAVRALRQTLQLSRRRGLVRTYLDSGVQVMDLMRGMLASGSDEAELLGYLAQLLGRDAKIDAAPAKSLSRKATVAQQAEILTEREIEIVGMLGRVLTNKKIARALGISDGTVKWHMKNVYGKLGVTSRDEALARCRDLGLLS